MRELKNQKARLNAELALSAVTGAAQVSIIKSQPILKLQEAADKFQQISEILDATIGTAKALNKIMQIHSRMFKFWRAVRNNRNRKRKAA